MNDTLQIPQRALDIYRCIKGAADRGEQCPTNNFLAAAGGYSRADAASNVVSMLEDLGLITVTRSNRSRMVVVHETGKSTKAILGKPIRYLDGRRRRAA